MVSQSKVFTSALNQNLDRTLQIAKYGALLANDKKAEGISVLSVSKLTSYADYFVICTATSARHTQALARYVIDGLKKDHNINPLGLEGLLDGNWILLDFGDVVFHIFSQEGRDYYDLDGLWADAKRIAFTDEKGTKRHLESKILETCDS